MNGYFPFYGILGLSLIAMQLVFWLTRWGIAINNDSTVYIASALNYSRSMGLSEWAGNGQLRPMTHFPPLYPLLLSFFHLFGIDPLTSARWLNSVLFGANIFLASLTSVKITRWPNAAIITGILLISSTHILLIHMLAITEPLFIFLVLFGVLLFLEYMTKNGFLVLMGSGLFLGAAALCRYIGLAFIFACLIYIIYMTRITKRLKAFHILSFLTISLSGIILWTLRNIFFAGTLADRSLDLYIISKLSLLKGMQTLLWWLNLELGMNWVGYLRFLLSLMIIIYLLRQRSLSSNGILNKHRKSVNSLQILFLGTSLIIYLVFLFSSAFFYDPAIMLDYRILLPIYILIAILFPLALKKTHPKLVLRVLLFLWVISSFFYLLWWGADRTASARWNSYERFNWAKVEAVKMLIDLPDSGTYYTNDPELLYSLTGKIPSVLGKTVLKELSVPDNADKDMPSYLIFFKHKVPKPFLPNLADIRNIPTINILSDSPIIYLCQLK